MVLLLVSFIIISRNRRREPCTRFYRLDAKRRLILK